MSAPVKLSALRRRSKYGNHKVAGFDSKAELRRYHELCLLVKAGRIRDLKRQVRIYLMGADGQPLRSESGRRLSYVADFTYNEGGVMIYEDRKGYATREFVLKRAILKGMWIDLLVT